MRERGAGFYHGLAIAAVVIWGTTFVSTKVLLTEGLSPAAIMFLRFLIAYAVLRTVCPRNERPVRFKDELMFAAAGITGGSMYFLTENMALQITLVSNVALLLTTSPIMTVCSSGGRNRSAGRSCWGCWWRWPEWRWWFTMAILSCRFARGATC